jgi:ribonucleoside-diphosphate reductase alpha chain
MSAAMRPSVLSHPPYDQDLALKRFAFAPAESKPRFDWRGVVEGEALADETRDSLLKVNIDGRVHDFDLAAVAEVVGAALTNLFLSRDEDEETIYSDQNRDFVAAVSKAVAVRLTALIHDGNALTLSEREIHLLIEKTLIENNAHDVAKSLLLLRHADREPASLPLNVRVIRRNNQEVKWDANHIEDVQDIVQEELMRQGHFKVAESYILYRAHRRHLRAEEALQNPADDRQESMILVTQPDGTTEFWDGLDLKRRIEYAIIGLDLNLGAEEIEAELRRSVYTEMKKADLDRTIILNAKSLIERDADFAKFAGRILLTYIYEEVLGWNRPSDGIGKLKEAHQRAFRHYLKRGVEIERLNPACSSATTSIVSPRPSTRADSDFDYLGIQTLYDRYLIVDKVAKPNRRLETPQFFWMRVAMGLFLREEGDRRGLGDPPLQPLQGPPLLLLHADPLQQPAPSTASSPPATSTRSTTASRASCCAASPKTPSSAKWAGGLGGSWTAVRGTGGYIKGTNGESQGVIPFLKLHNDQLVAVNQGGKRRGSGCAYLETWHNDILDFLELRKQHRRRPPPLPTT